MRRLRELAWRLRRLVGAHSDRDFDDEVAAHLQLLTDRFVREGMTPRDARDAARRQFGNLSALRETRMEMQTFASLTTFIQDLRYGVRLLRRSPGWTTAAVLTLALGIGANVAIFSVVRSILLKPFPYVDPERIVVPRTIFERYETDRGAISFADILDWKGHRELFAAVAPFVSMNADITEGDEPERVRALATDEEYFDVMASPPHLGRFFKREENVPNGPRVVVLGHGLWTRRFGGDPRVIGRRLELRGVRFEIIGVAQRDATWPPDAELFAPLETGGQPTPDMLRRDNHEYEALARLAPGVRLEDVQAAMTAMGARIARSEPNRNGTNWKVHTLTAWVVGADLRVTLLVLLGASLCVLLIACVNVTSLLLARGTARARDVAVRAALGASRMRIARQFLAESAVLSVVAGAAGVLAGYWGLQLLVRAAPADIPRLDQTRIDAAALAFAGGLCILSTVLAGLVPAYRASRIAPGEWMTESGRTVSAGLRTGRLRSALVVAELALAIVLLTATGLLVRSFARIQRVDPGVTTQNVLTLHVSLPRARYAEPAAAVDGFERLVAAVRRVPGVTHASATSSLPLGGGGFYLGRVFLREGQPEPPASSDTDAAWSVVQPDYFRTVGIPVVQGRSFSPQDTAASPQVIIISRSMARRMFPNENPLGRRIRSWRDENVYREIVGVVGDHRHSGLLEDAGNNVFVPHAQDPWRSLAIVVRTSGDPTLLLNPVRSAIWSVDAKLPVADARTLDDVLDMAMARPRFTVWLLMVFGATALALAAIGIYGVVAYSVMLRRRELGVRLALGAARSRVVTMVAWNALRLAATGVALGVAGALATTRLVDSLLFEVSPNDLGAFAAAPALLVVVSLAAAAIPARRASRLDPVTTLRCE